MSFTVSSRSNLQIGFAVVFTIALLILAAPATAQSGAAPSDTAASEAAQAGQGQADDARPDQARGQGQEEEACPDPFAQVDVTVDPESEPLLLEPDPVEIYLNPGEGQVGLVCWVVTGLAEGQTLHIEGKEGEPDLFPNLQRTITAPRDRATSGLPSASGSWTYSLWITEEGSNEKLHFTDPEVIVRGDG